MPVDWSPFVELVRRHQRFLLTTHVRPDGDGLGSMLALDDVLRRLGKEVQLVIASMMPARYQFLDPERRIQCFSRSASACLSIRLLSIWFARSCCSISAVKVFS